MLADSSTPSGARSTARDASATRSLQPLLEDRGEGHRLIEVVRLRQVPRHQLDVAHAAAEGRHAIDAGERARDGGALEGRVINGRAGGVRPERRVRVQADEEIGLVVVGDGGPVVERHVAVVVSRQQHANAEPRLDGGFDAAGDRERQVLLFRARPRLSRRRRRRHGRDRAQSSEWRKRAVRATAEGRAAGRPAPPRLGAGGAFRRRRHHIDRQTHRRVDRQRRGAESGDARPEIHAERRRIQLRARSGRGFAVCRACGPARQRRDRSTIEARRRRT